MMYVIVTFLGILDLMIYYRLMNHFFEQGEDIKKRDYIFYLILNILVTSYCTIILQLIGVTLIAALIMYFFLVSFYQGSLSKRILFSIAYSLFTCALTNIFLGVMNHVLYGEHIQEFGLDIAALIAFALSIIFRFLIVEFVYRRHRMIEDTQERIFYLFLFPAPFISAVMLFIVSTEVDISDQKNLFSFYMIFLFAIVINVTQFWTITRLETLYAERMMQSALLQNFRYRENYYKNVEQYQGEIRRIRHDIKNQLIAMQGLLSNHREKEAGEELTAIISDIVKTESIYHTKNVGINAILCAKQEEIEKAAIRWKCEVEVPEECNLSAIDMGVLIGNTLDNALEACLKCKEEERFIDFSMHYYAHKLMIACKNSMADSPLPRFRTRKNNKLNHGIGLKSIDRILNKYQGSKEILLTNHTFEIEMNLWNV